MGFIDQIMGAMGMEAAQTVTEEPTSNADPHYRSCKQPLPDSNLDGFLLS